MIPGLLDKYDRRVPRYTSYPTAPQFDDRVKAQDYRGWLAALDPDLPLSLYLHIPFCDSLCWFCACHTKIVRRYAPVAAYLELLLGEIDLAAGVLGQGRGVCHLHLGGGTPTVLEADGLARLFDRLRRRFALRPGAEIAVESDPRELTDEVAAVLGRVGVTRASLGLQDINPEVQRAVNRVQSFEQTARAAELLRAAGVGSINIDLMYGLPHQTVERLLATVEAALRLAPERVCLFGYAHVPWMMKHQRLIDEAALPGPAGRFAQFQAAAARLEEGGYVWIGLDHFALPGDPLAIAAREGSLHRNFQGYTTDDAPVRLGFGASAIGLLPQGHVQNAVPLRAYRDAVAGGRLPVARGLALDDDDRLRAAVIERLMCDLEVDLEKLCREFDCAPGVFAAELSDLAPMQADGLVVVEQASISVTEQGRPFVRTVCAVFDRYLQPDKVSHVRAV
ncbi:MAG: oxygen-independent coproporphyrinogen III oxidase [Kiloniellaceae bacterium]